MIKIKSQIGNLMHVAVGHLVHGCNAQGVMGSGVALGIRQNFPTAYEDYTEEFKTNGLQLGYAYPSVINANLMVWNAITQNLYGTGKRLTNYEAVATCFERINSHLAQGLSPPNEVHIPLIGAARGGGNWEIIREIIEQTMDYPVTLWLPDSTVTTR